MTIIEQARALLAAWDATDGWRSDDADNPIGPLPWRVAEAAQQFHALAKPEAIAALCRALIVRTEAMRELMDCADSLRDFVAEGGSRYMVGATAAIIEADRAIDA